ncbi:MAG: hypothetical protein QOD77_919 [Thermoplasmata archaeon]|jgi:hypothetical protein|nr:hypothetical protein [Thermoplasmata archaeon]
MRAFALLAVLALVAGCTNPTDPDPQPSAPTPPAPWTHVLQGAVEPAALEAPTFTLLGAIAKTGPVYGGGEPSAWAALDGSLAVAFPGCDAGFYLVDVPGQDTCGHGLVYRSTDDGATWTRLNRAGDGRYSDDGPAANGDAEVAVDAAGTLYASNLGGGGIQVHAWRDGNWTYLGSVVEQGEGSDRQWMAAGAPGHLVVAWMGSGKDMDGKQQGRAVLVNTTFDGGATWTGALALGSDIGWLGPVAFAPDATTAYIPFTQPSTAPAAILYGSQEFTMKVARTRDGGRTWEILDTGATWRTTDTGGHWSGLHMAPALDVTGDGTVVVAYATDFWPSAMPTGAAPMGTSLWLLRSADGGATWDPPAAMEVMTVLPGDAMVKASPIMPWVVGGAGDRFAVAALVGTTMTDSDYEPAQWGLRTWVLDGFGTPNATVVETIVDPDVHLGGVCTRGGTCQPTGSDRALLDFFEAEATPDGRLFIAYPADPLQGGKYIEIRAALQSGGTPLLERPAAPQA